MAFSRTSTWPLPLRVEQVLLRYFRKMFRADGARLSCPLGEKIFLIIGAKRNTKMDKGQWVSEKGDAIHWDYLAETCIASGDDVGGLVESARHYKFLKGKTGRWFLEELGGEAQLQRA